jgi:hypothetical protein
MRSGFATGFILLYLIALCKPIAPLIEYYSNKDFFANVLCINKNKPEMHCNGQCVLMQRLKAAMGEEQPSQSVPMPKIEFKDYPVGIVSGLLSDLSIECAETQPCNTIYVDLYTSLQSGDFFHPPRSFHTIVQFN